MRQLIRTLSRISLVSLSLVTLSGATVALPASASSINPKLAPCAVKVSGQKQPKTLTKTESINFQTFTHDDSTLPAGQTKVTQAGQTGKRLITYTASYKKGKLSGCKHTGTKVTKQPVSQLVANGTYVTPKASTPVATPTPTPQPVSCDNGTYVNSAGNTVCRPEQENTAPEGATAQCRDGSYSFSQSRSGTCSHHGGVGSWL